MKILFDETKHTKWYVTETGRILSECSYQRAPVLKERKATRHKRGYSYVRTSNGNYQLHRLVASAFVPNQRNNPCVNHKDGNKQNNNADNLEWVTHKENTKHAINNGLLTLYSKNHGANLKYTDDQCRDVICRVKSGMSYIDAGKKFNMPYSTVAHLIRGSRRLL